MIGSEALVSSYRVAPAVDGEAGEHLVEVAARRVRP
jgi:hypothetical protein